MAKSTHTERTRILYWVDDKDVPRILDGTYFWIYILGRVVAKKLSENFRLVIQS